MRYGVVARRTGLACLVPPLLLMAMAAWAEGGAVRVRGEGAAPGQGALARLDAVEMAHREIAVSLFEQWGIARDMTQLAPILDDFTPYIVSSRVVREHEDGQATLVEVEAYVQATRLRHDAALLLMPSLARTATVLLLVVEDMGDGAAVDDGGLAARALREQLRDRGFAVAGLADLSGRYTEGELRARLAGTEGAARLAVENMQDVVVAGRVAVRHESAGRDGNLYSCTARVSVDVMGCATGETLGSFEASMHVNSEDAALGSELAVRDACAKLADEVAVACVVGAAARVQGRAIDLLVESPGSSERVREIVDRLRNLPPVGNITIHSDSGIALRLQFDYEGPLRTLVRALTERSYGDFALEPYRVVDRSMVLRVVR